MHGRWEGEERKRRNRHMLTGPTTGNNPSVSAVAGDVAVPLPSNFSPSLSGQANFFYKDGRKISVGDCALFKPPQDSPPFVGLIRSVTTGKENKLKLGVYWLYRPAEVELGKGILLEAAPNEIFFSFHEDETLAASLLHPCKVAFLPKGVELPSRICSFVCRRVYDITNKCLWWLTDQDYINERQEEVDQLLCKTRIEMHATVQPGGRSPKPMNGPTSQLKPGSDNIQNSASSFPSQVKGKKRDRGDQGSEPIKRERYTKVDDGESIHYKSESMWRSEIAKFTDRGGLVDSEGVEKLVHLMLPERNEKKIDLAGRCVLAGVVAATEKFDCLNRFVQLRGLPVFDEWLQEVHKGKVGDGGSPKDSDKSVEEFLLVLLRALDKLPVNLYALQMCNIGKSVNHLRQHKNLEIQKKARSLVDTWKKRVEAEMDAKSGPNQPVPWTARSRLPEVSHGGNKHTGASSEVAVKSPVLQVSASKAALVKLVQGETTTKSTSASPGSMKSAPFPALVGSSLKEGSSRNIACGVSDIPPTAARDEKSSSSSQSHNNSQSCFGDHAKTTGLSSKEDTRSCTAGSVVNKTIVGSSRQRKSANGFPGSTPAGVHRETGSSRGSLQRSSGPEKLLQSSLTSEKTVDVPMTEGISPKLVVKISNRGRSPAQSTSGGSIEDLPVINSRASSPVISEKHEQFDCNLKEKNEAYRTSNVSDVNTESWQSNDLKEVLTGSEEGDGSPANITEEEHCRTSEDTIKVAEVSKGTSSSSGNELKEGKFYEASFCPMNALIESCVKDTEANASISAGDDIGINLLASVAAGEMSKSDMISPIDSPRRSTLAVEPSLTCSDSRVKSSPGDEPGRDRSLSVDDEQEKRVVIAVTSLGKTNLLSQGKSTGELNGVSNSSVQHIAEPCHEDNVKAEETATTTSVAASTPEKISNGGIKDLQDEKGNDKLNVDCITETKEKSNGSDLVEDKVNVSGVEVETKVVERSPDCTSLENDPENKKDVNNEQQAVSAPAEQKSHAVMNSGCGNVTNGEVLQPSASTKDVASEGFDKVKAEKADETDEGAHATGKQKNGLESNTGSAVTDKKVDYMEENVEGNQINEIHNGGVAHPNASSELVPETEQQAKSKGSKFSGTEIDEVEECTSAAAEAASGGSDGEAKLSFDLNEGFSTDDGKFSEPFNSRAPASSATIQLTNPFLLPVSSASSGLPASITVAAAAKGPFVPPEDLLKNRGELGWKGSAATSAFRPAEPRKIMEMPLCSATSTFLPDASAAKPSRLALDIDLNVPDERILEDFASRSSTQASASVSDFANSCNLARDELMGSSSVRGSGGLDLDLNKVDEPTDTSSHMANNGRRMEVQFQPVKSSSSGLLNGEMSIHRDFDLNDGPIVDEVSVDPSPFGQQPRNSVPSQPSISGLRINNSDVGNFPSWFPQVSSYPAVTIQSIMPDRGDQPFPIVTPGGPPRMLTPPTGSNPFGPDVYRGPVLSSSPAVPFPSTPFQYSVFPFGTSFPLPSASFSGSSTTYVDSSSGGRLCFPAVHSQVLAPTGVAVPSPFARPYVVNLPDGTNGGAEGSRKWGRQSLDLNAGPLGPDVESRDETSSFVSRQLSVAGSSALADEQSRIYQVAGGGVLKRKEPEGGWEGYKQSWQ